MLTSKMTIFSNDKSAKEFKGKAFQVKLTLKAWGDLE